MDLILLENCKLLSHLSFAQFSKFRSDLSKNTFFFSFFHKKLFAVSEDFSDLKILHMHKVRARFTQASIFVFKWLSSEDFSLSSLSDHYFSHNFKHLFSSSSNRIFTLHKHTHTHTNTHRVTELVLQTMLQHQWSISADFFMVIIISTR